MVLENDLFDVSPFSVSALEVEIHRLNLLSRVSEQEESDGKTSGKEESDEKTGEAGGFVICADEDDISNGINRSYHPQEGIR